MGGQSRGRGLSTSQVLLNLPKDQLNQTNPGPKAKKHDYAKIVTNKKYVCFDEDKETCGSYYLNEWNATESEIDIRETIKKTQKTVGSNMALQRKSTKRSKASKQHTKAKIKDDGLNRHISNSHDLEGLLATPETGPEIEEEEEVQDFEETEAMIQTTQTTHRQRSSVEADKDNNQGEASSVSSTVQSQTRTYYSLKQAIDEKFVPPQIRNLRLVANGVWAIVILLSIVFFIIQSTLFTQIKSFVGIIAQSEQRIGDIMHMNLRMSDIALVNEGYLSVNSTGYTFDPTLNTSLYQQVITSYTADFMASATSLSKA